jgi:hypothetical protein
VTHRVIGWQHKVDAAADLPDKPRLNGGMLMGHGSIDSLAFTRAEAEARRSADAGPIERLFFANDGRVVHKWIHFLPVYDRYIAPYAGSAPVMLEIGVSQGGSIEMWRKVLGADATIFGIDINPDCIGLVDAPNQVRIGSQDDAAFLGGVLAETGPLDIVLDDGSHIGRHQIASFRAIWPQVKPGGLYMIEDLHTSYWTGYEEGGMRKPGTGIEFVKSLIDDQHAWYHDEPEQHVLKEEIGAIHIYDSIAVIEKIRGHRPGHLMTNG